MYVRSGLGIGLAPPGTRVCAVRDFCMAAQLLESFPISEAELPQAVAGGSLTMSLPPQLQSALELCPEDLPLLGRGGTAYITSPIRRRFGSGFPLAPKEPLGRKYWCTSATHWPWSSERRTIWLLVPLGSFFDSGDFRTSSRK